MPTPHRQRSLAVCLLGALLSVGGGCHGVKPDPPVPPPVPPPKHDTEASVHRLGFPKRAYQICVEQRASSRAPRKTDVDAILFPFEVPGPVPGMRALDLAIEKANGPLSTARLWLAPSGGAAFPVRLGEYHRVSAAPEGETPAAHFEYVVGLEEPADCGAGGCWIQIVVKTTIGLESSLRDVLEQGEARIGRAARHLPVPLAWRKSKRKEGNPSWGDQYPMVRSKLMRDLRRAAKRGCRVDESGVSGWVGALDAVIETVDRLVRKVVEREPTRVHLEDAVEALNETNRQWNALQDATLALLREDLEPPAKLRFWLDAADRSEGLSAGEQALALLWTLYGLDPHPDAAAERLGPVFESVAPLEGLTLDQLDVRQQRVALRLRGGRFEVPSGLAFDVGPATAQDCYGPGTAIPTGHPDGGAEVVRRKFGGGAGIRSLDELKEVLGGSYKARRRVRLTCESGIAIDTEAFWAPVVEAAAAFARAEAGAGASFRRELTRYAEVLGADGTGRTPVSGWTRPADGDLERIRWETLDLPVFHSRLAKALSDLPKALTPVGYRDALAGARDLPAFFTPPAQGAGRQRRRWRVPTHAALIGAFEGAYHSGVWRQMVAAGARGFDDRLGAIQKAFDLESGHLARPGSRVAFAWPPKVVITMRQLKRVRLGCRARGELYDAVRHAHKRFTRGNFAVPEPPVIRAVEDDYSVNLEVGKKKTLTIDGCLNDGKATEIEVHLKVPPDQTAELRDCSVQVIASRPLEIRDVAKRRPLVRSNVVGREAYVYSVAWKREVNRTLRLQNIRRGVVPFSLSFTPKFPLDR